MSVYNWSESNTLQTILPKVLMHSPSPKFATYDLASLWFSNWKYLELRQAQQITIYLVWDRGVGRPTRKNKKKKPMVTINAVNLVALTWIVSILNCSMISTVFFRFFAFGDVGHPSVIGYTWHMSQTEIPVREKKTGLWLSMKIVPPS